MCSVCTHAGDSIGNQKKLHLYANLFMVDNSVRVTCAESKLTKIVLLMHFMKTSIFL